MSEALKTGMNLPLGEALSMGGETTVIGLSIVFGVLIILMIVLMLFKVIFYKDPKKQQVKSAAKESAPKADMEIVTDKKDLNEAELIAVMTAAIAASLNTSTYNLRIKSYRRTDSKQPAWNKAGLNESINNRF